MNENGWNLSMKKAAIEDLNEAILSREKVIEKKNQTPFSTLTMILHFISPHLWLKGKPIAFISSSLFLLSPTHIFFQLASYISYIDLSHFFFTSPKKKNPFLSNGFELFEAATTGDDVDAKAKQAVRESIGIVRQRYA